MGGRPPPEPLPLRGGVKGSQSAAGNIAAPRPPQQATRGLTGPAGTDRGRGGVGIGIGVPTMRGRVPPSAFPGLGSVSSSRADSATSPWFWLCVPVLPLRVGERDQDVRKHGREHLTGS
jgi:hypothetical protein